MTQWQVTVTIPAHLSVEAKDDLLTHIADAVHLWEPEERNGWDPHVTAGEVGYDPGVGPFVGPEFAEFLARGLSERLRAGGSGG